MEELITKYLRQFKKLRRATQYGGAPHKPILLLSLIEGIRRKEINSNRIYITPDLILCFRELWSKLVDTPHSINFSLPFFHMRSEPFWKLVNKPGMNIVTTSSHSVKSLKALNDAVAYAELDIELYSLLTKDAAQELFYETLVKTYFPSAGIIKPDYHYSTEIVNQILNESGPDYQVRIKEIESTQPQETIEEELFVRGGLFKREIPKIYNYTCAISGLQITTTNNVQMVDACHIVPFSISKDDTIGNGIALTPTIHRAFDRGLIAIDENLRILISSSLVENQSTHGLSCFNNKMIQLPNNKAHYPSNTNLVWHHKSVFL